MFGFIDIYLFIKKLVETKIPPATIRNGMPFYLTVTNGVISSAPFILLFLVAIDPTIPQIIFDVLIFSFIIIMTTVFAVDLGVRMRYIVNKYISINLNPNS